MEGYQANTHAHVLARHLAPEGSSVAHHDLVCAAGCDHQLRRFVSDSGIGSSGGPSKAASSTKVAPLAAFDISP